jgi:hypothetical protein
MSLHDTSMAHIDVPRSIFRSPYPAFKKRSMKLMPNTYSFIHLVFQRSTKVDTELVIVQSTNRYIKIVMGGCNT